MMDEPLLSAAAERTLRAQAEEKYRQFQEGHFLLEKQWAEVNTENSELKRLLHNCLLVLPDGDFKKEAENYLKKIL